MPTTTLRPPAPGAHSATPLASFVKPTEAFGTIFNIWLHPLVSVNKAELQLGAAWPQPGNRSVRGRLKRLHPFVHSQVEHGCVITFKYKKGKECYAVFFGNIAIAPIRC
eukprot:649934-Rhodomonas_salina.3